MLKSVFILVSLTLAASLSEIKTNEDTFILSATKMFASDSTRVLAQGGVILTVGWSKASNFQCL